MDVASKTENRDLTIENGLKNSDCCKISLAFSIDLLYYARLMLLESDTILAQADYMNTFQDTGCDMAQYTIHRWTSTPCYTTELIWETTLADTDKQRNAQIQLTYPLLSITDILHCIPDMLYPCLR